MITSKPYNIGVSIRNMSRLFGNVKAIGSLTLEIEPGLLHGIIGPDGAGKTTFMRILAGLLKPQEGAVEYSAGGEPVLFESLRPYIAYMPSRASLYPDLSIEEHLEFFRKLYEMPDAEYREKAGELLAITRLDKFKGRLIKQLSGGMYKKAGLMCALLRSPSVLLLDEPTNGVDPISRREFWELLYGLADKKILIIISTAYMDEAERCARVHFIDSGKLLTTGEPEAILKTEGIKNFEEIFMREKK